MYEALTGMNALAVDEPVTADEPEPDARAIVPLKFLNLTENVKERRSKLLTGEILERCGYLRFFLLLVFGEEMVQEQRMKTHVELVKINQPEGLPVLARANALDGRDVSLEVMTVIGGAFVVSLENQLKKDAQWMSWPDRAESPHITLAFIGKKNMDRLWTLQKALVCQTLKYLAIYGEGSFVKLEKAVRHVRRFVVSSSPPRRELIDKAIKEIADIIQNA